MNISKPFILRPVATCLLTVAILLVGLLGYRGLSVSALPSVDYPTVQVVTLYPGASPKLTAATISSPLEKQLGQVTGVTQMLSQSSNGVSIITLQFDLSQKLSVVEQDIQAAINTASSLLPNDLPSPPIYHKVNPADPPILTLAVTSDELPMTKVQDLVDTRLAQKLSQVSGVGLITFAGGQRSAVRIYYNPQALSAMGLDAETIRTNVNSANVNQAKGSFNGADRAATITANDQLQSVADYENLVVAYKNSTAIRLKDIARVEQGAENSYQIAEVNNVPAILIQVQKQPGANVIATVDAIKSILPQLEETLPAQINVKIISDRTDSIRASISDVQVELLIAIALVIMVIYIFLRKVPATLIPSIAVPLSLIGTFAVLYALDFSINNLTLMALTIATGFVVDDAIVVIENISRHIEKGLKPIDAALKGAGEIGFTIISLTFSLVAVLIPLLFMPDLIGRLFREFAVTLAVAILISAVISLTLTPMMCAYMLHPESESQSPRWLAYIEHLINRTIAGYGRCLKWVLNRQLLTLAVTLATFVLTVVLFISIHKGFFPIQDNSQIIATVDVAQTSSFKNLAEKQRQATDIILKNENVTSVTTTTGVDSSNLSPASGSMQIQLKPVNQRKQHITQILEDLQSNLNSIPGLTVYLQAVQDLTVDTIASRAKYQISIQASNMAELSNYVPKILAKLQQQSAIKNVNSDLQDNGLECHIIIDKDTASRLGVTTLAIDTALYNAFGQRQISTIFTQTNQYQVVLGVAPELSRNPSILNELNVIATNGKVLPLLSLAKIEIRNSPLMLNRLDQFPYANISFDLKDGFALSEAINQIAQAKTDLDLPFSVSMQYQGSTKIFKNSLSNEIWLIIAAIVVMYIVLGVLYESYIHPITILSTLPTAGVGALLALMLYGKNLDIIGIIGLILLIGIVKKNAIMMIDFALSAERDDGLSPKDAIYQACLLRFRPILMTTLAAALGALPLMLGNGVGAEMRQPLGITIVGGLLFSQVLTLFTTPVIYLTFDKISRRWLKTDSKLLNSADIEAIDRN